MISIFTLLLLAAAQFPMLTAPEPINAADGDWYEAERKIAVRVSNGVATITEFNSARGPRIPGMDVGTVVAIADGSSVLRSGYNTEFHGKCYTTDGRSWGLMKCDEALVYGHMRNGDQHLEVSNLHALYRRSFFDKPDGYQFRNRE